MCLALAWLCLSATWGLADGWEIETTGGMLGTSSFAGPVPFSYRGLSFEGPYTTCPLEVRGHPRGAEFGCFAALGASAGNIFFSLQGRYGPTWTARVQARRQIGKGLGLGAGMLAGLGRRQQRVVTPLPQLLSLDLSAPVLPDDLRDTLDDPSFTEYDSTGTDALAYLHAGLGIHCRRAFGSDVTLSLLHVHSLGDTPDDLTRPEFRWTGFQLGIVLDR